MENVEPKESTHQPKVRNSFSGLGPASRPNKRTRGITSCATQFYCKGPSCDKVYSTTDAVRRHCKKEHAEWLRSLTAVRVGPVGYCSCEAGI